MVDKNYVLGLNVRYFRKKKKITARKLAEMMNYTDAWLSYIENNKLKEEIPYDVVEKFAFFLDTTPQILLNEDENVIISLKEIDGLIKEGFFEDAKRKTDELIVDSIDIQSLIVMSHLYTKRGNVEYYQRRFDDAILYYETAIEIATNAKDWHRVHLLRQNLADANTELARYDLAEKYLLDDLREIDDYDLRATTYLYLGRLYCQQERWLKAEEALEKVMHPTQSDEIKIRWLQLLSGIELNKGNFEKSIILAQEVISCSQKKGYVLGEIYGHRTVGDCLVSSGNKNEARFNITRALDLSKAHNFETVELEFLLSRCDENIAEAYERMKDILEKAEKKNIAPRMLAKMYETTSDVSYNLNLINDLREFTNRAIQLLRTVVR